MRCHENHDRTPYITRETAVLFAKEALRAAGVRGPISLLGASTYEHGFDVELATKTDGNVRAFVGWKGGVCF